MTLQEIKDQVLNDRYPDLDILLRFESASITTQLELWPEVCRRAQLECARETLKVASEKAIIRSDWNHAHHEGTPYIDKNSITDEANIKLIQ